MFANPVLLIGATLLITIIAMVNFIEFLIKHSGPPDDEDLGMPI